MPRDHARSLRKSARSSRAAFVLAAGAAASVCGSAAGAARRRRCAMWSAPPVAPLAPLADRRPEARGFSARGGRAARRGFRLLLQQFPCAANFRCQGGFLGQRGFGIHARAFCIPILPSRSAPARRFCRCRRIRAHRRIFAGLHPVFAREVGVKVHLANVGVGKFANFEVNDQRGNAVAGEKNNAKSTRNHSCVDPQPLFVGLQNTNSLPSSSRNVSEVPDERLLQIAFRIFILQIEKFQQLGGLRISSSAETASSGLGISPLSNIAVFVFRQRRALVKLRVDLPVKLAN